jgi:hypothetical protein
METCCTPACGLEAAPAALNGDYHAANGEAASRTFSFPTTPAKPPRSPLDFVAFVEATTPDDLVAIRAKVAELRKQAALLEEFAEILDRRFAPDGDDDPPPAAAAAVPKKPGRKPGRKPRAAAVEGGDPAPAAEVPIRLRGPRGGQRPSPAAFDAARQAGIEAAGPLPESDDNADDDMTHPINQRIAAQARRDRIARYLQAAGPMKASVIARDLGYELNQVTNSTHTNPRFAKDVSGAIRLASDADRAAA